MTRHIQTKTEITVLLDAAGLKPQRRLGQNFLIDGNLMNRLLDAAELTPSDIVLEIGPGTGSLTDHLVTSTRHVVAIEFDRGLHQIVAARFASAANLTLIHGDVLETKNRINPHVDDAMRAALDPRPGSCALVSNLPYQVATPLLVNLLLAPYRMDRFCFTVQREVAERLTASPATRDYGPVSVVVQSVCDIERIASLPPHVFWPRPAVDSTMLRVRRRSDALPDSTTPTDPLPLAAFAAIIRSLFAHRRKTIRFSIAHAFGDAVCEAVSTDFDLAARPERLDVPQWIALANRLHALAPPDPPSPPS
ncbi:MAG: ribosomal RNA small subunit methyltransferase A [Phycisphaerales bacterium]|nr:ribosomal RNA small subunit methyltransferase A [Phycisphaerales bacterium]